MDESLEGEIQPIDVLEEVKCNICDAADNEFALTVPDCADSSLSYRLVRCRKCDLTFVSPRPKGVHMHKYYPDDTYYAYQNNQMKWVDQKVRQRLKTYLMEWAGGYRPSNDQMEKRELFGSIFSSVVKNHLIGIVPSKFLGKLLDVGCGNGELMIWYQRHGWDTVGIEPSAKGARIARARGLEIIESTIEEANLPDDYFNAITMVQVLEHLKDPKSVLRKLYRVLRPGGLIVAGVPNFLCLDRQVMGSAWLPLETPRHLYYFTPKSLQTIFKTIGFNTLQLRKKTIYGVTLSQIKESCRSKSVYKCIGNITYIVGSPFIKLLAPKDYSSTFISIYARK